MIPAARQAPAAAAAARFPLPERPKSGMQRVIGMPSSLAPARACSRARLSESARSPTKKLNTARAVVRRAILPHIDPACGA